MRTSDAGLARDLIRGSVGAMNKSVRVGLGVLLVLVGLIWTLQGLDVLKGSAVMSGKMLWAIIGSMVAIFGVVLVAGAGRARD